MIYYIYNGDELLGFKYNDITYYYHKNMFDDVVGILDVNYNEIVTYEYDSWGNILSVVDNSGINLSTINPYRYRSYYYDEDTKLYYLNNRYYDAKMRRFINSDIVIGYSPKLNGFNLFQYAFNNPVMFDDSNGKWPKWIKTAIKTAKRKLDNFAKKVKETLGISTKITYEKDIDSSGITIPLVGGYKNTTTTSVSTKSEKKGKVTLTSEATQHGYKIGASVKDKGVTVGFDGSNGFLTSCSFSNGNNTKSISFGVTYDFRARIFFGDAYESTIEPASQGQIGIVSTAENTTELSLNLIAVVYAFAYIPVAVPKIAKIFRAIDWPQIRYPRVTQPVLG